MRIKGASILSIRVDLRAQPNVKAFESLARLIGRVSKHRPMPFIPTGVSRERYQYRIHFLLIYKTIIKPMWTYGLELWGSAKPSNTKRIQTLQSLILRKITNAPFVSPTTPYTMNSTFLLSMILP